MCLSRKREKKLQQFSTCSSLTPILWHVQIQEAGRPQKLSFPLLGALPSPNPFLSRKRKIFIYSCTRSQEQQYTNPAYIFSERLANAYVSLHVLQLLPPPEYLVLGRASKPTIAVKHLQKVRTELLQSSV